MAEARVIGGPYHARMISVRGEFWSMADPMPMDLWPSPEAVPVSVAFTRRDYRLREWTRRTGRVVGWWFDGTPKFEKEYRRFYVDTSLAPRVAEYAQRVFAGPWVEALRAASEAE